MKNHIFKSIFLVGLLWSIASCSKNEKADVATLQVKLKDAPGDYQQVNVEILQIKVNHEGSGWIDLPTTSGIYDLLTLQNNIVSTLVAPHLIPAGKINQLRMVLGDNNTVMIDSISHPLSTPSAQMTGLKINLNHQFSGGQSYEILLDFDAHESIVSQGNGQYSLKPVLKIETIQPI